MNENTFCSLPFTEIFLGPDGIVKPCCSAAVGLGSLNEQSIDEILQSNRAQSLRQSIIDDKWDPICKQCQRQAEQGVASERDNNLQKFLKKHNAISKEYFKLTRLDLRWSNTCNLSCTYCYEYFSSKWAEIKGIKINNIKDENEQSLLLLIEKEKSSVENILLLGGEPLLQKQNYQLIETLTGKHFNILTNLAVPLENNKIMSRLLKENSLQVGVSFETIGEKYEYVRHGASWEVFDNNLTYIGKTRKDIPICAHSLYSIYSAFNLIEFYQYITSKKIFKEVFWNLLESSGENMHASVFNLSIPLKKLALQEIDNCINSFSNAPGIENLKQIRDSLIESINKPFKMAAKNQNFLNEALVVEQKLSKPEGKCFRNIWPKLFKELQC